MKANPTRQWLQQNFDLAKEGDPAALNKMMEAMRPQVLITCYRLIGEVADAEDAAQDSMIKIFDHISSGAFKSSWHSLVYQNTVAASLEFIRRKQLINRTRESHNGNSSAEDQGAGHVEPLLTEKMSLQTIEEIEHTPERVFTTRESLAIVFVNLLQQLSPEARAAYLTRDLLGGDEDVAAGALNLPVTEVEELLTSARKAIATVRSQLPKDAIAPSDANAEKITRKLSRALIAKDAMRGIGLFAEDAVLVVPPIGAFFGHEAIATQLARTFEVGLAPHAAHVVELNGQPGLVLFQRRREANGVVFYPTMAMALTIAHSPVTSYKIVRIDTITDAGYVRKIGSAVRSQRISDDSE